MADKDSYEARLEARRDALLDAMLEDVPFDGWSLEAFNRGASRIGVSAGEAELAFPRGLAEIAQAWSDRSDRRMLDELASMGLEDMRVRDRVATAVRTRVMINAAHREALRRLLGWLAMPQNAPVALANTARTVNHMWYAAGDTSADWNYYSKRGLLAPVYSTTVLYWLADDPDESGDYPATWSYLDRRIDDVLKTFGMPRKIKARLEAAFAGLGRRRSA